MKYLKGQNLFSLLIIFLMLFSSLIKEPWHDELYTKYVVQKSGKDILNELKKDSGPPLYYFLIHYLTFPFKFNFFFIRLVSLLSIIFSGYFLGKIFKKCFNMAFPFYFYLLFPLVSYYSAEGRNYSLVIFLSTLFFYEALLKKRFIFLSLYLTLLLYTHNLSFFFITYLLFFYIYTKNKDYILSIISSLILYIPVFFIIKNQPKESIYWMKHSFDIKKFFFFFSNLGPNLFENYIYDFKPFIPALIFAFLNFILIIFVLREKDLTSLVVPFFINLLALFFICFKIINIYFPSRSEIFFFIPFVILLLYFFGKKLKISKYIFIIYLITSILSSTIVISSFSKPLEHRTAISKIIMLAKSDTEIYLIGPLYLTTNYALERESFNNPLKQFPPSQGEHIGWYYYPKLKQEDLDWLLREFSERDKSFLLIWIKSDPIGNEVKKYLNFNGKFGSVGNFDFYIK